VKLFPLILSFPHPLFSRFDDLLDSWFYSLACRSASPSRPELMRSARSMSGLGPLRTGAFPLAFSFSKESPPPNIQSLADLAKHSVPCLLMLNPGRTSMLPILNFLYPWHRCFSGSHFVVCIFPQPAGGLIECFCSSAGPDFR